jgi:hypothetical protein
MMKERMGRRWKNLQTGTLEKRRAPWKNPQYRRFAPFCQRDMTISFSTDFSLEELCVLSRFAATHLTKQAKAGRKASFTNFTRIDIPFARENGE